MLDPGESSIIETTVEVVRLQPFAFHEVLLSFDNDGDGDREPVGSIGLQTVSSLEIDIIPLLSPVRLLLMAAVLLLAGILLSRRHLSRGR